VVVIEFSATLAKSIGVGFAEARTSSTVTMNRKMRTSQITFSVPRKRHVEDQYFEVKGRNLSQTFH